MVPTQTREQRLKKSIHTLPHLLYYRSPSCRRTKNMQFVNEKERKKELEQRLNNIHTCDILLTCIRKQEICIGSLCSSNFLVMYENPYRVFYIYSGICGRGFQKRAQEYAQSCCIIVFVVRLDLISVCCAVLFRVEVLLCKFVPWSSNSKRSTTGRFSCFRQRRGLNFPIATKLKPQDGDGKHAL